MLLGICNLNSFMHQTSTLFIHLIQSRQSYCQDLKFYASGVQKASSFPIVSVTWASSENHYKHTKAKCLGLFHIHKINLSQFSEWSTYSLQNIRVVFSPLTSRFERFGKNLLPLIGPTLGPTI